MVRSCVDGPVFHGERVRFDDIGTIPPDAVGAPEPPQQPKAAGKPAKRAAKAEKVAGAVR